MIALTNSLHKLVNATIKYTGEPTRSRGEFAFNLGVDNWDQTYGKEELNSKLMGCVAENLHSPNKEKP